MADLGHVVDILIGQRIGVVPAQHLIQAASTLALDDGIVHEHHHPR
ncbi:MAG: hypothetical protein IPO29_06720 [Anaerolineae bacterium]|nr:hypothetical protein [Anaerolineae bacterium]